MKRFQFRQESLLRIRRQLRRQAEMAVMQARAQLVAVQHQKSELLADLERLNAAAWQNDTPLGTAFWQWQQAAAFLNHSIQQVETQIETHTQLVAERTDVLRQRTQEVEALDALRVRQWRQHQEEVAANRQQLLDEVAMGQWFQMQRSVEEETHHG
ncbi:MAG: hypothetical protein KDB23_08500 [Planctomycetales bacterium]|nr:hypothetical protein [Planctomycetales bacterium]